MIGVLARRGERERLTQRERHMTAEAEIGVMQLRVTDRQRRRHGPGAGREAGRASPHSLGRGRPATTSDCWPPGLGEKESVV